MSNPNKNNLKPVLGVSPPVELQAARLWAFNEWPYLGDALAALIPVEVKGMGTMAVDEYGRWYYDPDIFTTGVNGQPPWTVQGTGYATLHEVCHRVRDHLGRQREMGIGPDNAEAANFAADAEIHNDEATFGVDGRNLPVREPIVPRHFGFKAAEGKLMEEFYASLPKNPNPSAGGDKQVPGSGKGNKSGKGAGGGEPGDGAPQPGAGDCGSCVDGVKREWELGAPGDADAKDANGKEVPGLSEGEWDLVRRQVAEAINRGDAGPRGTIPAGWKKWSEKILRPRVDAAKLLAGAIRGSIADAMGKVDWTYKRSSRTRAGMNTGDFMFPGIWRPAPKVSMVLDESGSMSPVMREIALGVISKVVRHQGCAGIKVFAVDAAVAEAKTLFNDSQIMHFGGGGGGTDMRVGIEAALKDKPDVIIVVTDGETPWPDSAPRDRTRLVAVIVEPRDMGVFDVIPSFMRKVIVRHPDNMPHEDEY